MTPTTGGRPGEGGRLPGPLRRAGGRVRDLGWPLLQSTLAAAVSWVLARHVVEHQDPFFAPIAGLVALNAARGERGTNAVRLVYGVVLGIVVAEIALALLGPGVLTLAVATLFSLLLAAAVDGHRMILAQAGAGAILTVATGRPQVGTDRLVDALVGVGVALVITQLLFPTEPLGLLRRAESRVLADLAAALRLTATSLERDDVTAGQDATDRLRTVRDDLTELRRTRGLTRSSARLTPLWWSRSGPIVRASEDAGQLDLLGDATLALTRIALELPGPAREPLCAPLHELGDLVDELAAAPDAREVRQRAADRALATVADLPAPADGAAREDLVEVRAAVERVVRDIMVFAGVAPAAAREAVRLGGRELSVAEPPAPFDPRRPLRWLWRHRPRWRSSPSS